MSKRQTDQLPHSERVASNWFRVEIEPAARSSFLGLCRQFQRAFIRAGAPENMALFARTRTNGEAHKLYFSPGSSGHVSTLIENYNGVPCCQPQEDALTLLFGIPGVETQLLNDMAEQHLATKTA